VSAFSACISHEYRKRYAGAREKESNYTESSKGSSAGCSRREKFMKDNSNNGGEIL
jgi:hypothetical protein